MTPEAKPVPGPDPPTAPVPETLAALRLDPAVGLSQAEVETRRKEHGFNETAAPKSHPVLAFLAKFWGLSAWMLELIMALSAYLGNTSDLAVVGVLLVINAVVAFTQEHRAAGVVEALRKRLQVNVRVLRDSKWQVVPARDLVPGDLVRIRPGDLVPADIQLLTGALGADESALTGESKDADKAPGGTLRAGSVVRWGEGNGAVLATGAGTLYGRTTALVQEARPKLHIEAVVAKIVRALFAVVGVLVALVAVLSLVRGVPLLGTLPLMLVLLLSAVPTALPIMFTVSMAVGSRELAKKGVLVTRLSAVEDAATMEVLCVDKTGTITQNLLSVTGVIPLGGASEADALAAGAWASKESDQDPIDRAFLQAAQALPGGAPKATSVSFAPFDAKNRRTEAVVEQGGVRWRVMKGALRTLVEACGLPAQAVPPLEARVAEAAQKGFRTLAVARGPENGPPVLLGLVTLEDPLRPDARQLVSEINALGVGVKMLTGDALPVALQTGRGVGLPKILPMADLKAAGSHPRSGTTDLLEGADGFAEVFPDDKFTVVKGLQDAGRVVGMTGDGVNDAPALRQAEVGIAVSTATDVAKGAASVVLTEPGLTNILELVGQGRAIYQRVLTWIMNKINRTILKSSFVAVSYVVTGRFAVSAFSMLLLVFMTDFAKISLATDRVRPSPKPETWAIGGYIGVSIVLGLLMTAETLLFLWFGWTRFGLSDNPDALTTFSYLLLLDFALLSILSARERLGFWATWPSRTFLGALLAEGILGTGLTYVGLPGLKPLPPWLLLTVALYAVVACLGVNDAVKVAMIRRRVGEAGAAGPIPAALGAAQPA